MSRYPKLKQSQDRKDASKRYCKEHKIHYIDECPLCIKDAQKLLDRWQYGKNRSND